MHSRARGRTIPQVRRSPFAAEQFRAGRSIARPRRSYKTIPGARARDGRLRSTSANVKLIAGRRSPKRRRVSLSSIFPRAVTPNSVCHPRSTVIPHFYESPQFSVRSLGFPERFREAFAEAFPLRAQKWTESKFWSFDLNIPFPRPLWYSGVYIDLFWFYLTFQAQCQPLLILFNLLTKERFSLESTSDIFSVT